MSYTGVYINLDRSTERRAAVEAQLAKHRLQDIYRRLPAAEGNTLGLATTLTDAQTGCLISHYRACREHGGNHLHVVEDDVLFSGRIHKSISALIASPLMDEYDVLFLDTYINSALPSVLRSAKTLFDRSIIRDAEGAILKVNLTLCPYEAATASYLVRRDSIPKLLAIYEQAFADGLHDPVDFLLSKRGADGSLRVACIFPFLTSVRFDEMSTISDHSEARQRLLAINILRHSFFIERDIGKLLDLAATLPPANGNDQHQQLLMHMLGFFLTDGFGPA